MSMKLRELIRSVRACKTSADENAVITTECAAIRTAIKNKDTDEQLRTRNVAKLLYISMLGYPTHFGQMETLTLIASSSFHEKRIGYLGLMLLLDEKQEVLGLVTNSLMKDLQFEDHNNAYFTGLALSALGNICSASMASDLAPFVKRLMGHNNPYIRKKATLCALRIIRKVPELMENFISIIPQLIEVGRKNPKEHGCILSLLALILEIIKIDPKVKPLFRKMVPKFITMLQKLIGSSYSAEHDVGGITDPFLQCRIVQLLGVLGQGDNKTSEEMTDILAQVANNTDKTRNAGLSILYQCVRTITQIEAEGGLRVLAINLLAGFLVNRDNNIRYVALNTLCNAVSIDNQAIQRHRATIVKCLKDNDISIRRRALDLVYALVNRDNVQQLIQELLSYLTLVSHSDPIFKADLTERICVIAENMAPHKRWHIDTAIQVIELAGEFTPDWVAADFITLIANSKALHAYAVHKLFHSLRKHTKQANLVKVATWCIGEYGEQLVSSAGASNAILDDAVDFVVQVSEAQVLDVLSRVLKAQETSSELKGMVLSALAKLSARFVSEKERVKTMIAQYSRHIHVDLQQRSVEYSTLNTPDHDSIKPSVLAPMPILVKSLAKRKKERLMTRGLLRDVVNATDDDDDDESSESSESDDDDDDVEDEKIQVQQPSIDDLLGDLVASAPQPQKHATTIPAASSSANPLDLLDDLMITSVAPVNFNAPSMPLSMDVFSVDDIHISWTLFPNSPQPNVLSITSTASNVGVTRISDFKLSISVPKYLHLSMAGASGFELLPAEANSVTQSFSLQRKQQTQSQLVVRLRVEYNGKKQIVEISNFPVGL